jgi:hypothetical protein
MKVSCGQAPKCNSGQVAVVVPPKTGGGGGVAAGGIATAGPSATIDSASTTPAVPATPPAPQVETVCTDPPPDCPPGLSPQFTIKKTWECTDCSLVVTYGGIYGNYRRCVGHPNVICPQGQVPTWSLEDEKWECKDKCDNGLYDQHTIDGVMVCVPC